MTTLLNQNSFDTMFLRRNITFLLISYYYYIGYHILDCASNCVATWWSDSTLTTQWIIVRGENRSSIDLWITSNKEYQPPFYLVHSEVFHDDTPTSSSSKQQLTTDAKVRIGMNDCLRQRIHFHSLFDCNQIRRYQEYYYPQYAGKDQQPHPKSWRMATLPAEIDALIIAFRVKAQLDRDFYHRSHLLPKKMLKSSSLRMSSPPYPPSVHHQYRRQCDKQRTFIKEKPPPTPQEHRQLFQSLSEIQAEYQEEVRSNRLILLVLFVFFIILVFFYHHLQFRYHHQSR